MVLVLCILMSAYFIRGITGFGSALISVPLLALSQPLTFAVPLVLALDFTASLVLGGTNRKKAVWGEIKVLLPFGMVGACIGAYALLTLPTTPVLLTLGAFTMFSASAIFSACSPRASCRAPGRFRPGWRAAARARCSARAARPTSCT
jgi:uncharacterized membrane protein YfcA